MIVITTAENIVIKALLANVRGICILNDALGLGLASDLGPRLALDVALDVVDGDRDGVTVETGAIDGQQLPALSVALIMADGAHRGHYLDPVARSFLVVARLNRARVIHGVSGSPEECRNCGGRVTHIVLDLARHVSVIIGADRAVTIVQLAQVHASSVDSKVDRQLIGLLVVRGLLGVDADRCSHVRVDY